MSVSPPPVEHLFIIEDSQGRRAIPLVGASYVVGRARSCDIQVASLFVSRQHAVLRRQVRGDGTSTYLIIDGDPSGKPSVNGLLINGQKQTQHRLKHGDQVVFGPQVLAVYQARFSAGQTSRGGLDLGMKDDPFDITLIDPAMMGWNAKESGWDSNNDDTAISTTDDTAISADDTEISDTE